MAFLPRRRKVTGLQTCTVPETLHSPFFFLYFRGPGAAAAPGQVSGGSPALSGSGLEPGGPCWREAANSPAAPLRLF